MTHEMEDMVRYVQEVVRFDGEEGDITADIAALQVRPLPCLDPNPSR